jgi:hypothetical protein
MAKDHAARPMIDRLNSVPSADLAAELIAAFGAGASLYVGSLVEWFMGIPTPNIPTSITPTSWGGVRYWRR